MELKQILQTVNSTDYSAFFYTPHLYDNSFSYLFIDPVESVTIKTARSLEKKLEQIDLLIKDGYSAYSIINYETGYLFEKKLHPLLDGKEKLIQFFFCDPKNVLKIRSSSLSVNNTNQSFEIKNFTINNTRQEFRHNINAIKKYIKQGDTYQVNYTVKGKFNFHGDLSDLFIKLSYSQSALYSAFINNKDKTILSLSPELFFEIDGKSITAKPMKGTVRRGYDLQTDKMNKYNLLNSEKNRAENVMIVDLLRNDLGRISKSGSVQVPKLFDIEKYETLYQMVSVISSKLKKDITLSKVIKNIFPCGSITGAPKISTMGIINKIEKEPRGIYTGSIGFIHKQKKIFNVAIRTIVICKKTFRGELGLGSGIVWDSNIEQEFQETILKSRFLTKPESEFELFETMLLENGKIHLLEDHLNRLKLSASFFLFRYDDNKIQKVIQKTILNSNSHTNQKLKLLIDKWGEVKTIVSQVLATPEKIKVIISKNRIKTGNKYQYFKTTNRIIYDKENKFFRRRGFFDVIFFNERSELAEGAITNIFLKIGDTYFTPPVTSGILPGVYRKFMLRSNSSVKEKLLYFEDLMSAEEIILTNALKGEIKVNYLYLNETEFRAMQ
ncbi:MAG: aminodeoxychorismate synthase component I [Ignavibacterium sp.]|nr:aminodeoxychorismate synthase component I [Ignavibacterium sp.]